MAASVAPYVSQFSFRPSFKPLNFQPPYTGPPTKARDQPHRPHGSERTAAADHDDQDEHASVREKHNDSFGKPGSQLQQNNIVPAGPILTEGQGQAAREHGRHDRLQGSESPVHQVAKWVSSPSNTDSARSTYVQDDDDFPSVEELLSSWKPPVADCAETATPNNTSDCNFVADTVTSSPDTLHRVIDPDDDDKQIEEENNHGFLRPTKQRRLSNSIHDISSRHSPFSSCKTVRPASGRSRYTKAEDERFHQLRDRGISWDEIGDFFPGRRVTSLRKHYEKRKSGSYRGRSRPPKSAGPASSPGTSVPKSSGPAVSPVTPGLTAPKSSRPVLSPETLDNPPQPKELQHDGRLSNGAKPDALRRSTRKRRAPRKFEE